MRGAARSLRIVGTPYGFQSKMIEETMSVITKGFSSFYWTKLYEFFSSTRTELGLNQLFSLVPLVEQRPTVALMPDEDVFHPPIALSICRVVF